MSTDFITISNHDLLQVNGGKVPDNGGPAGPPPQKSPIDGSNCADGMAVGVQGKGKVKTPVGLEVEVDGTVVVCR